MKPEPPRPPSLPEKLLRNGVFLPAYVVGVVGLVTVMAYITRFHQTLKFPLSDSPAVWGAFGDYIGGVLNPLCAYMAFIWLVRSYALQKTELADTKKTLQEAQKAQTEQARLALITAQTQSFSIRLTVLGSTLNRLRAGHARAVAHANLHGLDSSFVVDDGSTINVKSAIVSLHKIIEDVEATEGTILDRLNELALHAATEPHLGQTS